MLFQLETALRELIIEALQAIAGPRWYRERLPGSSLEQFKAALELDRLTRWTKNVPHHPIYYVGFPDLRSTIELRENWAAAFGKIFPRNKDLVTTDLLELEFIRNKVAHNRRATSFDSSIVATAYTKLSTIVGADHFAELSRRYTVETNIAARLEELLREADVGFTICARGLRPPRLNAWQAAEAVWWWFDDLYLGYSLGRIRAYFDALQDYKSTWPKGRDTTDDWGPATDRKLLHTAAQVDLTAIIGRWRRQPTYRSEAT